jgi:hypothetical protein
MLGTGLHSDGLGPQRPYSREPLNPHPDIYFLIPYDEIIGFRKDGGLLLFLLSDPMVSDNYNSCTYRAFYWKSETAIQKMEPDSVSGGLLFAQVGIKAQTEMDIGPWTFRWSTGDVGRCWLYSPDPEFKIVKDMQWAPTSLDFTVACTAPGEEKEIERGKGDKAD